MLKTSWLGMVWIYLDNTRGDSTPEGTISEWLELANAIAARESCCPGRRVGCIYNGNYSRPTFLFYSPRNSRDYGRDFSLEEADAIRQEILVIAADNAKDE